ncbi:MAG TPA: thiamine pyrophosphate-dependent enzyme [Alphaproteobacteria bacterium]
MSKRRQSSPAVEKTGVGRRNFLKGASLAGVAALTPAASPQAAPVSVAKSARKAVPLPNMVVETMPPPRVKDPVTQSSSGGDFMVDVIKTLNIEYLPLNCASSFRGIQEAIVNYGGNKMPELITCNHEEIAGHMAQGYAKIEGKPLAILAHGTVGLQHASMAMYNAWCDRVPMIVMIGNIVDANKRAPNVEWSHSAQDPAAIVRDFTKWDDQPASLQHFAESMVRAYKIATTAPMAPVLISLDAELQENPIPEDTKLRIPKLAVTVPPQGDSGAIAEAAKLLVNAESPVIMVDRMGRTPAGMGYLVELAEALQCPVVDMAGRSNFPTRHPLCQTYRRGALFSQADVILGIEMNDYWGPLHAFSDRIERSTRPITKAGVKTISLGMRDLYGGKANYQDFQRYADVDMAIAGDGESTLPALTEAVRRQIDPGRKSAYEARGKKLAAVFNSMLEAAKTDATVGWDASPIATGRLCAELYDQIKHDDWSLVGNGIRIEWPRKLWNFDKAHRWNGGSGGAGVGYNVSASLGAALANKKHGRLTVTINGDGDFMMSPGTLWTAAHHQIPILYVIHNNRAYHQEYMYLQAMANRMNRGVENAHIGTTIMNPDIDYATVAKGFGVYGEGPISDPKDLGPALKRALDVVRRGEPALIDVRTDPR